MKRIKLLLLLIAAGYNAAVYSQSLHLDAIITGFDNGTVFRLDDMETQRTLDSAVIAQDKFSIEVKLESSPRNLMLVAFSKGKLYYRRMLVGNENIVLKGEKAGFPWRIKITGSVHQDAYNPLDEKVASLYGARDSLMDLARPLLSDTTAAGKKKLVALVRGMDIIDSTMTVMKKEFILAKAGSFAAVCELYYCKKNYSRDSVILLFNQFSDAQKAGVHGKKIAGWIEAGKPVGVGDSYADFEAKDSAGKKYSLSQFAGKYILLDFNETICVPCIKSLPALKYVAQKYANKLQVISFTADASKSLWIDGIRRDEPSWLSLWDGKGPGSETCFRYGVTAYPGFILINPQGKIIDKWDGYGEKLIESKMEKYIR